jgi:ankyrin repeat protein
LSELLDSGRSENPSLEQVQAVLAKGADVNWREEEDRETPLISALGISVDIVKEILSCDDILVNATCNYSGKIDTALIIACADHVYHEEMVKLLLAAKGIDINYQSGDGYTAIMIHCVYSEGRDVGIAKLFLEDARTNIHLTNEDGQTALELVHDVKPFGAKILEQVARKGSALALFKGEFLL